MPTFIYHGRNPEGVLVNGRRLSQSADNLGEQLLKEGISPINISLEVKNSGLWSQIKEVIFRKKITTADLAIFSRQMYTMTKAGLSLTLSIRQLAESTQNPAMSNALFGVAERLESGQDLASAMQNYSDFFSPLMISMVRVGQNSGRLDEIFYSLYEFLEMESTSIKRTKAILRYPILVLISIIIAIVVINGFVIPTFASVYAKTNIKLPWITQQLLSVSTFFTHHWIIILSIFILSIVSGLYYLSTPKGKYAWHKYQLRIPIIGSILKRIILLRFAQSFSVVVNSGIPLVDGISLVAQAIQNVYIRGRVLIMHTEIQRGKTLTQAAATANIFNSLELQMLSISEETGSLGTMLEQIAGFYQREVDYDLNRLGDIIEPVLIFGLSIVILFLALAVYLPIWNMVKVVHQ